MLYYLQSLNTKNKSAFKQFNSTSNTERITEWNIVIPLTPLSKNTISVELFFTDKFTNTQQIKDMLKSLSDMSVKKHKEQGLISLPCEIWQGMNINLEFCSNARPHHARKHKYTKSSYRLRLNNIDTNMLNNLIDLLQSSKAYGDYVLCYHTDKNIWHIPKSLGWGTDNLKDLDNVILDPPQE